MIIIMPDEKKVSEGDLWKSHYHSLRNAPQGMSTEDLEDLGIWPTEKTSKLISELKELGAIATVARDMIDQEDESEITMPPDKTTIKYGETSNPNLWNTIKDEEGNIVERKNYSGQCVYVFRVRDGGVYYLLDDKRIVGTDGKDLHGAERENFILNRKKLLEQKIDGDEKKNKPGKGVKVSATKVDELLIEYYSK